MHTYIYTHKYIYIYVYTHKYWIYIHMYLFLDTNIFIHIIYIHICIYILVCMHIYIYINISIYLHVSLPIVTSRTHAFNTGYMRILICVVSIFIYSQCREYRDMRHMPSTQGIWDMIPCVEGMCPTSDNQHRAYENTHDTMQQNASIFLTPDSSVCHQRDTNSMPASSEFWMRTISQESAFSLLSAANLAASWHLSIVPSATHATWRHRRSFRWGASK